MRQKLSILLRICLTALMLFFLFRWIEFGKIVEVVRLARLDYLIASCAGLLIVYVLCFIRWRLLLVSVDIRPSWKRLLVSYFAGTFFNLFLPSSVGGDLVRIVDLANYTRRRKEITATVLVDRLMGFTALSLTALFAMFIGYQYIIQGIFIPVLILFILLFSIITILFTRNVFSKIKIFIPTRALKRKIENLHSEIFCFRTRPRILLKTFMISLISQVFFIMSFYFIFIALGIKLNLVYCFIFVPLISVMAMVPISIGGLGVRDMGSAFFFTKVGIARDVAVAVSLLNFFFIAVIGILCGIVYVFALHNRWLQRC